MSAKTINSSMLENSSDQKAGRCLWKAVPLAAPDPILGVNAMFREDPSDCKVNLTIGAYRTEEGNPYVLPVVSRVERKLAADPSNNHEYLPITGLPEFNKQTAALIFGADSVAIRNNRVATVQALSGTGALRVGFTFLRKFYSEAANVLIPQPTWANHKNIVREAGLPPAKEYRYFHPLTGGLDFDGMIADLKAAPEESVVLFHGCAHNPTGADPSEAQWESIRDVCIARRHLPFFDTAYQGFATGDLDQDARSVRIFVDAGMDVLVAQSYAKNMGLYGQRVGALNIVCSDSNVVPALLSQLRLVIRPMYSSPPAHGAKIAAAILSDSEMFAEWQDELKIMSGRILEMREALRRKLEEYGAPGKWDRITNQIGMFSFTGLTPQQVDYLREKYHIYMLSNGRISTAGLTPANLNYVARAIKDAVIAKRSKI